MNTTYKADTKITFNYLEIPLFFEYEFNKSKKLFPYIQLCFSYNKILYVKEKVLSVETHATEYYFENIFLINQSLTLGYLNYKTISGNINAGLKYNIYKNFYIGIHAGIKYSKILKETNYLQPAGLIFKANLNLEIKL